jgi:hypothetical protein
MPKKERAMTIAQDMRRVSSSIHASTRAMSASGDSLGWGVIKGPTETVMRPERLRKAFFGHSSPEFKAIGSMGVFSPTASRAAPDLYFTLAPGRVRVPSGKKTIHRPCENFVAACDSIC